MNKLIDQETLLDKLAFLFADNLNQVRYIKLLKFIVDEVPSVWIPCKEKLPNNPETEVIICFSGRYHGQNYNNKVMANATFEEGKWFTADGLYHEDVIVHAWMPTPEPPNFLEESEDIKE